MTRHYSANAVATTLSAGINDSTTSISVAATTGFPAVDFILALDYGEATQELVLVTNVSGTTLTVTRGYDSTSAQAHSLGAAVRHVHSAIDFRDSRTHEAATDGVHGVTGDVVGTTDTQALTHKDLTSGTNTFPTTLATTAGSQTLTNKTIALGSNTVSGTKAQFNTALTDGDFATQAGAETLTNKTISFGSNTVSMTKAQLNSAVSDADVASLAGAETLTNKTIDLTDNTVTGTLAEFNAAVSDADLASLAGTETLSNKTLDGVTIQGTVSMPTVIQAGVATGLSISTTEGSSSVSFPTAFASAPVVLVQARAGDQTFYHVWTENVTTTGFVIHKIKSSSGGSATIDVYWVALSVDL